MDPKVKQVRILYVCMMYVYMPACAIKRLTVLNFTVYIYAYVLHQLFNDSCMYIIIIIIIIIVPMLTMNV